MKKRFRTIIKVALVIFLMAVIFVLIEVGSLFSVPTTRLGPGQSYPEMPPDECHHYLALPVDHRDPSKGQFQGFYILSPKFHPGDEVVFFLTDGQMELVDTEPDFDFFGRILPGLSYVLIGVRGQSPTLFPEVYQKDGSVNISEAMALYDSDQQVEDIEAVRQDMGKKGLLPTNGKIRLMGASGAGVLAQQYLARYGGNVSRAILEVTGAPDLSLTKNISYSRDLDDYDPDIQKAFSQGVENQRAAPAALSYLLYNLARNSATGPQAMKEFLKKLNDGERAAYWKAWLVPQQNLALATFLLSLPSEVVVKVRMWELAGAALLEYAKSDRKPVNLLAEFSAEFLGEFLSKAEKGEIRPKSFSLDRSSFDGEVLVISGAEDIVFSPKIGQILAAEYKNSRLALLADGHRMLASQEYLPRLRTTFLLHGFSAGEFQDVFREKPQLNQNER